MSTILVVDDDAMTLRMLEYNLGAAGHQVVTTTNAAHAADLAARHRVDAVILDVMMPGRSGFEVMADLNEQPRTRDIPILMLSSLAQSSHRVKGLREGADEYVGKPFDPEELLLRLNRLLNLGRGPIAEFEGNLATIPFAEVTQSLLHSTTDGVLEVVHGNRRGQIVWPLDTAQPSLRLIGFQGRAPSSAWNRHFESGSGAGSRLSRPNNSPLQR